MIDVVSLTSYFLKQKKKKMPTVNSENINIILEIKFFIHYLIL